MAEQILESDIVRERQSFMSESNFDKAFFIK